MQRENGEGGGGFAISPDPRDWLAAIIEGSDDAIISKNLSGFIQSWNPGAIRLFGYKPEEIIGLPITILIPEDRLDEEPRIISEIRNGRRVEHFETVRRRKDGSLVDLSLTISPIRNSDGTIVGASKIARDISERRLAEERQRLLMGEMQHRIKNLFAVASAIVSLTGRSEDAPPSLTQAIQAKLSALARAHELTMANWNTEAGGDVAGDLISLLQTVLEPYRSGDRVRIEGDSAFVGGSATSHLALLIYELATNSSKYGALSVPEGKLVVQVKNGSRTIRIDWAEYGGPPPKKEAPSGFGSRLESSLARALDATINRDWKATGMVAVVEIPYDTLNREDHGRQA